MKWVYGTFVVIGLFLLGGMVMPQAADKGNRKRGLSQKRPWGIQGTLAKSGENTRYTMTKITPAQRAKGEPEDQICRALPEYQQKALDNYRPYRHDEKAEILDEATARALEYLHEQ